MIAGALNFTLGLQANQFLNTLGASSGKLLGLLGVANGISGAFRKMWEAVEQGGKLTDVAAAASLTVKQLYQLEQAFTNVGASADSVPGIINKLRRTLASGEQNGLLAQLGLDPAQLAAMDPAAQFEKVASAIAKVNVNSRAGAAQALFGREGAQTIQQIANSGSEFAEAMQRASADAEVWQNVSATFDTIADQVTELEAHIKTVWANLAGALIEAFREGRIGEVLTDILVSSFQAGFAALPGLVIGGLVKIGEVLLRIIQEPLLYMQTTVDYIVEKIQLGTGSFAELLAANRENGLDFFGANMGDIGAFADAQIKAGIAAGGAVLSGLNERLSGFSSRLPQGGSGAAAAPGPELSFSKRERSRTDFTDIEKMGGVLNGLGRGFGGDDNRQTANNTKRAADLLASIDKKIGPASGANLVNE
jgi:hypothetical protein